MNADQVDGVDQFELFNQRRAQLLDTIDRVIKAARTLGMRTIAQDIKVLRDPLRSEHFKVLIMGDFNRGKSTFINALLCKDSAAGAAREGRQVAKAPLPMAIIPETGIICEVKFGAEPRACLHHRPSEGKVTDPPKWIEIDQIKGYVSMNGQWHFVSPGEKRSPYQKMELFWPLKLLDNGVEIIDSPGLNHDDIREQLVQNYITQADAVIFMLSCGQIATRVEQNTLNLIRNLGHDDIFLVCNFYNVVLESGEDTEQFKQYAFAQLARFTRLGADTIFFIDARSALTGRLSGDLEKVEHSGVPEVERELEQFLTISRGRVKLQRPITKLRLSVDEAHQFIVDRRKTLGVERAELQERLKRAEDLFNLLREQCSQAGQKLTTARREIETETVVAATAFLKELEREVPAWIDSYQAEQSINLLTVWMSDRRQALIDEIIQHVQAQIEDRAVRWQRERLRELLGAYVEPLAADLSVKTKAFARDLAALRKLLTTGKVEEVAGKELEEETVALMQRVAGDVASHRSDLSERLDVRSTEFYTRLLSNAVAGSGSELTGVFLGGLLAILGLFFRSLFTLDWGMVKVVGDIKRRIAEAYRRQFEQAGGEQARKVAAAVDGRLSAVQRSIVGAFTTRITSAEEQAQSSIAAAIGGEQELADAQAQLDAVDAELKAAVATLDALSADLEGKSAEAHGRVRRGVAREADEQ